MAARLTQCCTGKNKHTDPKVSFPLLPLISPIIVCLLTSGLECMCFHHLCKYCRLCLCLCVCHMAMVYKQSAYRYQTPELFWPLLLMHAILSVRSPCGSLQAKVTRSHSSSSLAFCLRVQVAWKSVFVWSVCTSCLTNCILSEGKRCRSVLYQRHTHTETEQKRRVHADFQASDAKRQTVETLCRTGMGSKYLSPHMYY